MEEWTYLVFTKNDPKDLGCISDDFLVADQLDKLDNEVGPVLGMADLLNCKRMPDTARQASNRILDVNRELDALSVCHLILVLKSRWKLKKLDQDLDRGQV